MDSESEHEHRDDESISEQEEVEDTKPKSAMKKTKEAPLPVERPELP
jgi:translation initiation factor 2 subunit 3